MTIWQRRRERNVGVIHVLPTGSKLDDDLFHFNGVPNQNCIRQKTEAGSLVHDFVQITSSKHSPVGKEKPLDQIVARLASIKLFLNFPAQSRVRNIAEEIGRFNQPT